MDREAWGTVAGIVALGPAIFAGVGPSYFTVREFAHSDDARRDIRTAEIVGTVFTIGLGFAAGLVIDETQGIEWAPVIGAVVVSAFMVGMYEHALAHPRAGTDMATGAPAITFVDGGELFGLAA